MGESDYIPGNRRAAVMPEALTSNPAAAPDPLQALPDMSDQHPAARHLVLFDGGCGFCRQAVLSIARIDDSGMFQFASLHGELARKVLAEHGLSGRGADSIVVLPDWHDSGREALDRSAAVLFIVRRLAWPWKIFVAFRVLPRPVLDRCYDLIARNRHRLARDGDSCQLPELANQDRFLG